MIKKQLDFAFLRTSVEVDNLELDLHVDYKLTELNSDECIKSEWSLNSIKSKNDPIVQNALNSASLYHDEQYKLAKDKVFYLDLTIKAAEKIVMPQITIDLRFALDNMQSLWLPSMYGPAKNFRAKGMLEYGTSLTTHICNLMPLGAFYSSEGVNKLCFALEECKNVVQLTVGAYEEEECGRINFKLFTTPSPRMSEYKVRLRLDTACMSVFKAIENAAHWFEKIQNISQEIMEVPECALDPVYSTWYAFLQNISDEKIEEQCAIASQLGLKNVIVDDGWQTEDNNRGYAYCGDWQIAPSRFKNMHEHVKKVHALGMKYMVWFSVPFIGRCSKNHAQFKDMCLCFNPRWDAYVLDPRYKEVRQFLVSTFSNMVKRYDLDGLKLDFIDDFDMRQADEHALAIDEKRDCEDLIYAIDLLMTQIRDALKAIKPNILIEFRQNYIGPMIRKYGNMLRAHDCPNDTLMNRLTTLDLRATSGKTAIHSDMFIWSPSESVESASLNFIHTLFAVPQVSPNFNHLNSQHKAMVTHWLKFWQEHKELLMHGDINAYYPELCYSLVSAIKNHQELMLINTNSKNYIFYRDEIKELTLVNGSMFDNLIVTLPHNVKPFKAQVTIYNCLGEVQNSTTLDLDHNLYEIKLPKSGYAKLSRP